MAAAAMHAHLPSSGWLPILGSNAPPRSGSAPGERRDEERAFIAQFDNEPRPLSPRLIAEDPKNKKLGMSSKTLGLDDFELLKTLGTGKTTSPGCAVCNHLRLDPLTVSVSGTFARVWLARLTNPSLEDRDKVFALKILRKIDSERKAYDR